MMIVARSISGALNGNVAVRPAFSDPDKVAHEL
jgi:hypothetical protein